MQLNPPYKIYTRLLFLADFICVQQSSAIFKPFTTNLDYTLKNNFKEENQDDFTRGKYTLKANYIGVRLIFDIGKIYKNKSTKK